jgi:hypothetical protein
MARYMREDLRNDLKGINDIAKERGKVTYLSAEGRNGYTGLDEYSSITNRCIRNITCGTPKECLTAALEWAI